MGEVNQVIGHNNNSTSLSGTYGEGMKSLRWLK